MFFTKRPIELPSLENALPGRNHEIDTALNHFVLNTPLKGPIPDGFAEAMFGMGCFWGVERIFWQIEGVWTTAVGYAGGHTPNATYEEVCSGMTGHNEVVYVVYDVDQRMASFASKNLYQQRLDLNNHGKITSEILDVPKFFYAETYHQQYLAKNPDGYCGIGGTGVTCPIGVDA
ncbi:peptide-methionine (S)-S-oxide reductase [Amylibacter sp.]|nr:peptide-methionine (S)-S-oxide reductase [Amylibacter sp.]